MVLDDQIGTSEAGAEIDLSEDDDKLGLLVLLLLEQGGAARASDAMEGWKDVSDELVTHYFRVFNSILIPNSSECRS